MFYLRESLELRQLAALDGCTRIYSCSATHKDQILNLRSLLGTLLALLTGFSEFRNVRDVNRNIRIFPHIAVRKLLRFSSFIYMRWSAAHLCWKKKKKDGYVYLFLLLLSLALRYKISPSFAVLLLLGTSLCTSFTIAVES